MYTLFEYIGNPTSEDWTKEIQNAFSGIVQQRMDFGSVVILLPVLNANCFALP